MLAGFETAPPTFAPTFKLLRGSENEYNALRTPSWTDRILWR